MRCVKWGNRESLKVLEKQKCELKMPKQGKKESLSGDGWCSIEDTDEIRTSQGNTLEERAFEVEGPLTARALRWEWAWQVQTPARSPGLGREGMEKAEGTRWERSQGQICRASEPSRERFTLSNVEDHHELLSRGGTGPDLGFKGIPLASCGEWTVGARTEAGGSGRRVACTNGMWVEVVISV